MDFLGLLAADLNIFDTHTTDGDAVDGDRDTTKTCHVAPERLKGSLVGKVRVSDVVVL